MADGNVLNGDVANGDVANVLRNALAARADIADRSDRCRAVLGDLLGRDASSYRRELALLVAAVEERVPAALRTATTVTDIDTIAARFQDVRALEPRAARWTVDVWSDALRSTGIDSIPTDTSTQTAPDEGEPNDARASVVTSDMGSSGAATEPRPSSDTGSADPATRVLETRRPRRALIVMVAVLVIIGLVAGAAVVIGGSDGGSDEDDPRSNKAEAGSAAPAEVQFPTTRVGKVEFERTWTLNEGGTEFKGVLAFTVPKGNLAFVDEVVPKSLATRSKAVKLHYDRKKFPSVEWVKNDPVFRIVPKPGVKKAQISYTIAVPADGEDEARLNEWRIDAERERLAWEKEKQKKPPIKITNPAYDQHFDRPAATFVGTTKAGSKVALLGTSATVGGPLTGGRTVSVDRDGNWSIEVPLMPGVNWVQFRATSSLGATATEDTVVYYDPPATGSTGGTTSRGTDGGTADTGDSGGTAPAATPAAPTPGQTPAEDPPTGGGGGGGRGQTNGGDGAPSSPPVANDDYVSGYYGDADMHYNGTGWWRIIVGSNDTFSGSGIQMASVGRATYGATADASLCNAGYLCVWYQVPCDGQWNDSFQYTIRDADTGVQATGTVYVTVTGSNDGDPSNDC